MRPTLKMRASRVSPEDPYYHNIFPVSVRKHRSLTEEPDISIKDTRKDINTCVAEHQGSQQSQQNEPSGAYESQQPPRKDEDKGGSYRRKVGKFTRQLVMGQDEKEEDVDWNEYAGMFQIMARKSQ